MNIIEAASELKDGKKIRRKGWHYSHYIYCNNNDILFDRFKKEFVNYLKSINYMVVF